VGAVRARGLLWVDVVLGLGVTAVAVLGVLVAPSQQVGFRDLDVVAVLFSLAQGLPLVTRRRAPVTVLGVVSVATVGFLAAGYPPLTTALLGAVVATYGAAAYGRPRRTLIGAGLVVGLVLSLVAVSALRSIGLAAGELGALVLAFVTAWVLGDRMRTRRAYLRELEDRAYRLEQDRVREARAAVDAERARIARELHDVVAHGVSVIVLHARGAREVVGTDPVALRRSLDLIETTGREALSELRTVLGALRAEEDAGPNRGPLPGVADLGELARRSRDAGVDVDVVVEGTERPVPPGVGLSAFRIVQEALTNVRKHSTATSARVVLRYAPDRLLVQIVDDGQALSRSASTGHGLVGMRERVTIFGGELATGPRAGGGYEVLAVLPLGRSGS
jgi:signal transduction histidine kinase